MKQFILGLAIGALVTFSSQHFFSYSDILSSASTDSTAAVTTPACDTKTVVALSSPQEQYTPAASKPSIEKIQTATNDTSSELESLREKVTRYEQLHELEKLAQPGKAEAIAGLARREFEQETIDNSWSSQYQNQLSYFFRSDDQLHDVVPQSIECRSSRCRISIAVASQQHFNQVSNLLIKRITSGDHNGITPKVLVSPEMEQGTLQLYVARDTQVSLIP